MLRWKREGETAHREMAQDLRKRGAKGSTGMVHGMHMHMQIYLSLGLPPLGVAGTARRSWCTE